MTSSVLSAQGLLVFPDLAKILQFHIATGMAYKVIFLFIILCNAGCVKLPMIGNLAGDDRCIFPQICRLQTLHKA